MTPETRPSEPGPAWQVTGAQAREVIRHYLAQFAAHARPALPIPPDAVGEDQSPAAPPEPLDLADMPDAIMRLLQEYRTAHPGTRLSAVRYLAVSSAGQTTQGHGDLPGEDGVVAISITETVASAEQVHVTSHVLLARPDRG